MNFITDWCIIPGSTVLERVIGIMKKKIIAAALLAVMLVGCGKEAEVSTEANDTVTNEVVAENDDPGPANAGYDFSNYSIEPFNFTTNEEVENAAGKDYTAQIEKEVKDAVDTAESIQDELDRIEALAMKYDYWRNYDVSQTAMNMASQWPAKVWDTELNNLWSRMSNELSGEAKETPLEDLRKWNKLKERAIVMTLGNPEDGGSMYSLSYNGEVERMTKRKVFTLAEYYANNIGQSFTMPDLGYYGVYINDEGTSDIYDSMVITENYAGDEECIIGLYRITELNGTVEKQEDNVLKFTSEDGSVKGEIHYVSSMAQLVITESTNSNIPAESVYTFNFIL